MPPVSNEVSLVGVVKCKYILILCELWELCSLSLTGRHSLLDFMEFHPMHQPRFERMPLQISRALSVQNIPFSVTLPHKFWPVQPPRAFNPSNLVKQLAFYLSSPLLCCWLEIVSKQKARTVTGLTLLIPYCSVVRPVFLLFCVWKQLLHIFCLVF